MKKQSEFTFNGFEPANTTPVPDVLFDELLSELTGAELKVLLYIIRRTAGFKKPTDAISLSQFQKGIITRDGKQLDRGCGVSDRQTIIDALDSLEKRNCIIGDRSKTSRGDNAVTVYRIYFRDVVGKTYQGSMEKPTTLVEKGYYPGTEKPTTVVGDSNPQETVIQSNSLQETDKQEGTYRASEQPSQQCANAQPAPVSDVPYLPDFKADSSSQPTEGMSHGTADSNGNHLHRDAHSDSVGDGEHTQSSTGHTGHDVRLPAAGTDAASSEERTADGTGDARTGSTGDGVASTVGGGSGYKTPAEKRAEQQNLTGARSQQGARQQGKQNEKPQLTLMGQQVRESYEIIRAIRLRLTPNNVKALNDLGDMDGMDFTSLKETIELIEAQNLVKSKDIPIDVQELASEKGYWRFDKWYPVVLRNRQKQAGQQAPKGDNNLADWVAESQQQQERMSQEESARRTEEARRQLAAVQQQIAAQKAAERQQQAVIYRVKGESYA